MTTFLEMMGIEDDDYIDGLWNQTYTGKKFHYIHIEQNEIDIVDIARSLSLQCRYAGHITQFYSVAEHSVRAAREMPEEIALWGLLHDAAEAYTTDIVRPLKHLLKKMWPGFALWEEAVEAHVLKSLGLDFEKMPKDAVKEIDTIMLLTEKRDLLNKSKFPWNEEQCADTTLPMLREKIVPWAWEEAEHQFLKAYEYYSKKFSS